MREVISIHVGGAGVKLGSQLWELFCLEHNICRDGSLPLEEENLGVEDDAFKSFFHQTNCELYRPRCLFLDLEPTEIEEIKYGAFRRIYSKKSFVSSKEGSGGTYGRGLILGKDIQELVEDRLRKFAEKCSSLSGFLVYRSVGGGTGSSVGDIVYDVMKENYSKKTNIGFTMYPSNENSVTSIESYHTILSMPTLLSKCDVNFVIDNKSLLDICRKKASIDTPTYDDMNQIACQPISSALASMRFDGALNVDISEFITNLVPFPRINSTVMSYSKFQSSERSISHLDGVTGIVSEVFEKDSFLASMDPKLGKYMACCVMFRGDVVPADVGRAISKIKTERSIQFVDWSPTGFKCGINYQGPTVVIGGILAKLGRSVCMLGNTTSVCQVFKRFTDQFDAMFEKRAFVHWYDGVVEENQFLEAREDMRQLEDDYKEMVMEGDDVDGSDGEFDDDDDMEDIEGF